MFKPMRSYLKNKLTDADELTKIRNKLFQFLDKNPDVDHYLDNYSRTRWWVGVVMGILLTFIFIEIIVIALMVLDPAMFAQWLNHDWFTTVNATSPNLPHNIHYPLQR